MAETSFPTAGGGSVTDANYELLMASATGDGLVGRPNLSPLAYGDSSGRQIKIRAGRGAIVRGFRWQSDAAGMVVPIAANTTGQTRVDNVVLRLDRSTYNVRVTVLQGTASSTPAPPPAVYADPPSPYFDMPLAQVTVRNNASLISAADVEETTWYLAEPMLIGKAGFNPPVVPGRIFRQNDFNTTLIGNSSGGYETVTRDSGWVQLNPAAGWTANQGLAIRRKGDVVFLNISLVRSGATISLSTDAVVGTIGTVSYRPEVISADGVFHCSAPDHSSDFYVDKSTGNVVLNANGTHAINANSYVWGATSWPVSW